MTVDEIHESLLAYVPDNYDKTVGSFFYDLLRSVAVRMYVLLSKIDTLPNEVFALTAVGEHLDRKVYEQGIERRAAEYAKGIVTITGRAGEVIRAGAKVAADNILFSVDETASIPDSGTIDVGATCTTGGTVGNVRAGTINRFPVTLPGVYSVTNNEPFEGGYDAESDDDIIYEPVKLVCDALRQPLTQIDVHNEKSKAEHQQLLEQQMKEFETNLELDKKKRENEIGIEKLRMQEEINQMIADNAMKRQEEMAENEKRRREEMIQMEMRYRKEMAEAATRLEQIMVNMQVETRSKIFVLYQEKTNGYLESQQQFEDKLFEKVEKMKKLFLGEKGEDKIMDYYFEQLDVIAQRSADFAKSMNEDMVKVLGTIDDGMKEMTGLATKYFKPAEPGKPALTQNVVDEIEGKCE